MLRIKGLRWEFGTVLPDEIKYNLCEQEVGDHEFINTGNHFDSQLNNKYLLTRCVKGEVCIISQRCYFCSMNLVARSRWVYHDENLIYCKVVPSYLSIRLAL